MEDNRPIKKDVYDPADSHVEGDDRTQKSISTNSVSSEQVHFPKDAETVSSALTETVLNETIGGATNAVDSSDGTTVAAKSGFSIVQTAVGYGATVMSWFTKRNDVEQLEDCTDVPFDDEKNEGEMDGETNGDSGSPETQLTDKNAATSPLMQQRVNRRISHEFKLEIEADMANLGKMADTYMNSGITVDRDEVEKYLMLLLQKLTPEVRIDLKVSIREKVQFGAVLRMTLISEEEYEEVRAHKSVACALRIDDVHWSCDVQFGNVNDAEKSARSGLPLSNRRPRGAYPRYCPMPNLFTVTTCCLRIHSMPPLLAGSNQLKTVLYSAFGQSIEDTEGGVLTFKTLDYAAKAHKLIDSLTLYGCRMYCSQI